MNNRIKHFFANFTYIFSSNIISMLISIVTILVLPKVLPESNYGYIQLYIFYVGYTSYLSFGVADGVYIRYGGKEYSHIDKNIISQQYWIVTFAICLFTVLAISSLYAFHLDENKLEIALYSFISAIAMVPRLILTHALMATNNMKVPAIVTVVERAIYGIGIAILLSFDVRDYHPYIAFEIFGKVLATLVIFLFYKEMFLIRTVKVSDALDEVKENISVGINIVASTVASILIIGIIRFNISEHWNINVFGKVSLTLSISNFILVFVNSIAVVIFPILCRLSKEELRKLFYHVNPVLQALLNILLLAYYPIELILLKWLPNYYESIEFLAIVFPICAFESKVALLMNTYFKVLRHEKTIFRINFVVLIISVLVSTIVVRIFGNLTMAVAMVPALLGVRCLISEYLLGKHIGVNVTRTMIVNAVSAILFICVNQFTASNLKFIFYLLWCMIYIAIERNNIYYFIRKFKLRTDCKGEV